MYRCLERTLGSSVGLADLDTARPHRACPCPFVPAKGTVPQPLGCCETLVTPLQEHGVPEQRADTQQFSVPGWGHPRRRLRRGEVEIGQRGFAGPRAQRCRLGLSSRFPPARVADETTAGASCKYF